MSNITYAQIAQIVEDEFPEFTVIEPATEDNSLLLAPPEDFHHSSPVEIWIEEGEIEIVFEDEQVEPEVALNEAANVVTVATDLLQSREDAFLHGDN